ncbi:hypothetical protein ACFX1R_003574 [Malus domestica]
MYEYSHKDYPSAVGNDGDELVLLCELRKSDRTTEKKKRKFKANDGGGDCDDTAMQSKGKKTTPRKIDDKLVADDPISTPASMSIHDAVGEPYSNNNRCNHIRTCYCFLQRRMKSR